MFRAMSDPSMLAPDIDAAFPPEEMFAVAGDREAEDEEAAPTTLPTRGFETFAPRRRAKPARGFEAVVHELDSSRFWEPRRWVVRPARLLYCYAPNARLFFGCLDVGLLQGACKTSIENRPDKTFW